MYDKSACQMKKVERSWHKVRKKDSVWPKQIQNAEVYDDIIEVRSVSSDSDVVPCDLTPDSRALDDPSTDSGCMCVPCGRCGLVHNSRKDFCYASSTPISPQEGKYMVQQQGDLRVVRDSGMSLKE